MMKHLIQDAKLIAELIRSVESDDPTDWLLKHCHKIEDVLRVFIQILQNHNTSSMLSTYSECSEKIISCRTEDKDTFLKLIKIETLILKNKK